MGWAIQDGLVGVAAILDNPTHIPGDEVASKNLEVATARAQQEKESNRGRGFSRRPGKKKSRGKEQTRK